MSSIPGLQLIPESAESDFQLGRGLYVKFFLGLANLTRNDLQSSFIDNALTAFPLGGLSAIDLC
jgi:hypothetical protein